MSLDRSWGTIVWQIPGKLLHRVLGKMSPSRASQKDSTALIRHKETKNSQMPSCLSHTGKEVAVRTGGTQDVCSHDK